MADMVHPGSLGYNLLAQAYTKMLAPRYKEVPMRKVDADYRATTLANNPWDNWWDYFDKNPKYVKVVDADLVSVGSNYLDVGITYADMLAAVGTAPIYIVFENVAAQYFSIYGLTAIGANARFYSIAVTAAMQAAPYMCHVKIYQLDVRHALIANDIFIDTQVKVTAGAKEYYSGIVVASGTTYLYVVFDNLPNRIGSKFAGGFNAGAALGTLVVGGGINAVQVVSPGYGTMLGSPINHEIAFMGVGIDFTSWAYGSPVALYFPDTMPSPKMFENMVITGTTSGTIGTQTAHAHGLGYIPTRIAITPTSNGVIYQSAAADATNIYVKGSAASLTFGAICY
jgi:hypothetical protein